MGKATARCWMPARCTLMVLGSAPVQAVGWDTEQEIEAEVWLEKRAACSDHQTPGLSGKMNSRLFTLLSIPAPLSLNDTKGSRVVSIIGQGRQGL